MIKKRESRAQSSMEYLLLTSFILGVVLVLIVLFQTYSQETLDNIRMTQADQIARKIVDSAEKVYYLGEPSKITIKAHMPSNVKSITIGNNEIFFVLSTSQGDNEIGYVTNINISGSLPVNEGIYEISVESKGSYVEVGI
ncbi:hypothetical protein KY316_02565 [Candidatus Woesearchaeota archaeon]|nr:hypothetical protein [Candidatus Woesearchaeota archaeon]